MVTDTVRAQTQAEDLSEIESYRKWANAPERKHSDATKNVINKCLDAVTNRLKRLAVKLTEKIQSALLAPATKAAGKAEVKQKAKESVLAKLEQGKSRLPDGMRNGGRGPLRNRIWSGEDWGYAFEYL